jgi:hypothetical protein
MYNGALLCQCNKIHNTDCVSIVSTGQCRKGAVKLMGTVQYLMMAKSPKETCSINVQYIQAESCPKGDECT